MNMIIAAAFVVAMLQAQSRPSAAAVDIPTEKIESITGLKGAMNAAERVFKVAQPRTDVHILVDGRAMEPFMGLTTWAAFTPGSSAPYMVAGDLVLMQDEISPAMDAALNAGLSVTALHNHFLYDEPRVFFMHIGGEGTAERLAGGVRACLDAIAAIRKESPPRTASGAHPAPTANDIPAKKMEEILGVHGQSKDGMFKIVVGRSARMPCGCEMSKEMGVNTWAAFAGNESDALVDGDFAVLDYELQAVLRSLRHDRIAIVAIHQHMTFESPHYYFLHYLGRGDAKELASSLKRALDVQAALIPDTRVGFDDAKLDASPRGWKATQTGSGAARWSVVEHAAPSGAKRTLCQSGVATFPICLREGVSIQDGFIETSFSAVDGKDDRAGGVVWRARDENNYYVARANALENNVAVYHTVNGKRTESHRVDVPVASAAWHTLRVDFVGRRFVLTFDGAVALEWTDDALDGAGMIGLWTKADSRTLFDHVAFGSR